MFQVTHAITIDAPIERVWSWLVQMGSDRAGWYSWEAIDIMEARHLRGIKRRAERTEGAEALVNAHSLEEGGHDDGH